MTDVLDALALESKRISNDQVLQAVDIHHLAEILSGGDDDLEMSLPDLFDLALPASFRIPVGRGGEPLQII